MQGTLKKRKSIAGTVVLLLLIPVVIIMDFSQHRWMNPESVISYDIKGYYAYLPAAVIHKDVKLNYLKENPKEHGKWVWPVTTPTGHYALPYTMGLALLYLPFFLIAHVICLFGSFDATGYTMPYALLLQLSAAVYAVIGLFYLRKMLKIYFSELISIVTTITIFIATNLLMQASFLAPFSHPYSFLAITAFCFHSIKWHKEPTIKRSVVVALWIALVVLIRPMNVIVVLFFLLINVRERASLFAKVKLYLSHYKLIILIALVAFIFFSPQLLYWKTVSGKFFYNPYESQGMQFFFKQPQIGQMLFGFRKGWFIYTPVMVLSVLGIFFMRKDMADLKIALIITLAVLIYVLASWWSWWNGGGLGNRMMIDFYGLLALPLAAFIYKMFSVRALRYGLIGILLVCTAYNVKLIYQYNHRAIHYFWNSREGFFTGFFTMQRTDRLEELMPWPNRENALKGIYVSEKLIVRNLVKQDSTLTPEKMVTIIKVDLYQDARLISKLKKEAMKYDYSLDSIVSIEARNIYERRNLKKYIE